MTNSLYFINQESKIKPKFIKDTADKQKFYRSELSEKQTYDIFFKAIQKMAFLFEKSKTLIEDLNKGNENAIKIELINKLTENNKNIQLLNQQFIKLFSVSKNAQFKSSYEVIYYQFSQIEVYNALILLRKDIKYVENSIKTCEKIKEIFSKLIENIGKDTEKKETEIKKTLETNA